MAEENNEKEEVRQAIRLVAAYERKLQQAEEQKSRKTPRFRCKYSRVVRAASAKKTPRDVISSLVDVVGHLLQRSLKRYVLRKMATASFSCTMTKKDFIRMFQGFGIIESTDDKQRLKFTMTSSPDQSLTDKLGECLRSGGQGNENWIIRRFYGKKIWKRRDCAFVHIVEENAAKNKIVAYWSLEQTTQLDLFGEQRETLRPRMLFRFPRNTVPAISMVSQDKAANAKKAYMDAKSKSAARKVSSSAHNSSSSSRYVYFKHSHTYIYDIPCRLLNESAKRSEAVEVAEVVHEIPCSQVRKRHKTAAQRMAALSV